MVEAMGDFDRREWTAAESARRFECGSPNMLGIHAMSASLSLLLEAGMDNVQNELLKRSEYLFEKINSTPGLELITLTEMNRYAGIVTLRRSDVDNAGLYDYLMQNHVLCAHRAGGIRLSPHFYTPYEKLDEVVDMVMKYSQ